MQKTKIDYLDYTTNPIKMRCTPVSSGCANCWHIQRAKMLAQNPSIHPLWRIAYGGGLPVLDLKELEAPLRPRRDERRPWRIGLQFMGDLLHEKIDYLWFEKIMKVVKGASWHRFFLLTKRPERLYINFDYPKNLWLGVSVEDQKTYDQRASILSRIECAHRWISFEPLLGQITTEFMDWRCDWAVCGGETGSNARPMHPDWIRSVRDQCRVANVPFFFKSWGEWKPWAIDDPEIKRTWPDAPDFKKFGYKELRYFLDGKKYNEML